MLELNKIYNMDVREGLKLLDDESIDCCITSPPYWSLRDYGIPDMIWDDDPKCKHDFSKKIIKKGISGGLKSEKNKIKDQINFQITPDSESSFCSKCGAWKGCLGSEPNFELFIKHLCDIYDQIKRVLKNSGTCWVNLGDTHGGSGNASGHTSETKNLTRKTSEYNPSQGNQKYTRKYAKCLLMIPQRFAIEMINRGWILRNVIIWHKPNCMPSSAKDRFTVDFEYVYFFVKKKKYWFEQQREPVKKESIDRIKYPFHPHPNHPTVKCDGDMSRFVNPLGRNKRTVWKIPTKGNPEAHFATFPPKLVQPMIKAGCPEFICKVCGKPREKIIESKGYHFPEKDKEDIQIQHGVTIGRYKSGSDYAKFREKYPIEFKGYSDCGCGVKFKAGIVLDPFAGTGTTLREAWKLGRDYIGFEISKEYCEIAKRLLLLTKNHRITEYFNS